MAIQAAATNPYVGPRAFRQDETLYGRDREKRDLLDLLVARRIVLLYSPSGAGKSSLINAGLIPALKEDGFRVLPVVRVNLDPLAALGVKSPEELPLQGVQDDHPDHADHSFNRYIFSVQLSFEENLPVEERIPLPELASMSLEEYLDRCPRSPGEPEDDVLIFDQFEEIITTNPTDREGKKAFFAEVGAALRSRSRWALFAMREDYMPALDPYLRPVPTRFANTFRLDFLGVEAARQAVQNPALERNVTFTTDAADKLIDDLRTVQVQQPDGRMEKEQGLYVEPVQLQVVCFRLWEKLEAGAREISEADITRLEGLAQSLVDQSLAEYYSDCVTATAEELRGREIPVSEREIREWFEYRLITEHNVRGQVLRGIEASDGLRNEAILQLVGAHLVRAEKRAGATWYELAHDRLIQPVRESNAGWMRKNLVQLQSQAVLWKREGEKDSLLLRGQDLVEAQHWAEAHREEMRPVERRFLKFSQDSADQEERARLVAEREYQQRLELESAQQVAAVERQRAEAERQRAEAEKQQAEAERERAQTASQLAETERKSASRLRQRAFYLAGALIAALVLTVISYFLFVDASQQRGIALIEKENAERERLNAQQAQADAENSEILAVLQRATAQAAEAEERRQRGIALQQGQIATARQLAAQAYSLKNDQPDLALLLSLERANQLEENSIPEVIEPKASLVDVLTGSSLVASFYRDSDYVNGLAISRDGRRLLSLRYDRVQVWDLDAGRLITETRGVEIVGWSLSPDGKAVAYADFYNGVSVWNLEDDTHTSILPQLLDYPPALAYSPDGGSLAIAGQGLQLWQAGSDSIQTLSQSEYQSPAAFNQDGSLLAAVSRSGAVELWDLAAQERRVLPLESTEEGFFISSLAFSTGEQGQPLLAALDGNGFLLVWDLSSLQMLAVNFQVPGFPFVLSAGGTNLAYRTVDGTLQVCRLNLSSASCSPLGAFKGSPDEAGLLAFSPDGNLLAEGRMDGSILVWQLAGNLLTGAPLQASRSPVVGLAFRSLDGVTGLISATGDRERPLLLWDLSSPQAGTALDVRVKPEVDFISSRLALSPDGRTLFSGDRDGSLRLWDMDTLQLFDALYGHDAAIRSTAASPDGKYLASVDQEGVMIVWDLERLLPLPYLQGVPGVNSAAFSPDSKSLAVGRMDGTVDLWEIPTGFLVRTLWLPDSASQAISPVANLVFNPRNMLLAVGYEAAPPGSQGTGQSNGQNDGSLANLVLWDLRPANPIPFPLEAHKSTVSHLAFDPDGNQLASGDAEGRIYLWEVSEKRAQAFKGISGPITGLVFSRFDDFLIAGLDRAIARCRLDALTCESAFSGAARFTSNPVLIPGLDILAAGTVGGDILFWDLYTKEERGSIQSGEQEETNQKVTSLALSADGRTLALGGVDGSLLRWDLENGERLGEVLHAHAKAVTGLAFSSDGQWLASSGLDGAVKIWDSQGQEVDHFSERGGGAPILAFRPGSAELAIRYNPELPDSFGPALISPTGPISFEGSYL